MTVFRPTTGENWRRQAAELTIAVTPVRRDSGQSRMARRGYEHAVLTLDASLRPPLDGRQARPKRRVGSGENTGADRRKRKRYKPERQPNELRHLAPRHGAGRTVERQGHSRRAARRDAFRLQPLHPLGEQCRRLHVREHRSRRPRPDRSSTVLAEQQKLRHRVPRHVLRRAVGRRRTAGATRRDAFRPNRSIHFAKVVFVSRPRTPSPSRAGGL